MKTILKKIYIIMSKNILCFFYNPKFLTGKHFENSVIGYKWAWKSLIPQKLFGYNRHCDFPVSFKTTIGNPQNLFFHEDDLNNFQHFGCYFQCWNGKIFIGKGTYIAPNVGIITQNHDIMDLSKHEEAKDVKIGGNCWVGMNSIILPGVTLGNNTIIGAGSIVTKSFPNGNCVVVVGNPARVVKYLDVEREEL